MRSILAASLFFLSSISCFATSYAVQGGFFGHGGGSGYWTPRMLQIDVGGLTPNQIPFVFSSSNISVSCSPMCAIGDTFSINLTMTGFKDRTYGLLFTGSLDLTTQPLKITTLSGTEIARFFLTGDISGCYPPAGCFDITPNLRGYLDVSFTIVNGQMQVQGMSYVIPEPATMVLLGTGLLGTGLLRRRKARG